MVAAWLVRSEQSLGPELVRYMLDAELQTHIHGACVLSRSKANWFRILVVLAWIIGLCRWLRRNQKMEELS
ncbi:Quirky-like protein [Thalictrum thalictroides]|uniref:Quirky-like protein n=1 Tax=Thalictrum thalictroides TaxID=46969 RepID=A0A7J6V224_THATH|nr:Quirky-like protein [Thalictrum thalictroides]